MVTMHETLTDAGYLREYLAREFGPRYFRGGGLSLEAYSRFLRLARRLGRMAGLTLDQVIDQCREDAANV